MSQSDARHDGSEPRRLRITVSTTLPQGVVTAMVMAAHHDVTLHILDGAEPAVFALGTSDRLGTDDVTSAKAQVTRSGQAGLAGTDLLVVVAETAAQRAIALEAARWLPDKAVVLLAPGGVFGALEFARTLRSAGKAHVVGETTGFMHLGSVDNDGHVRATGVKRNLPVAFFPSDSSDAALSLVRQAFSDFERAENVLVTSLANTNVVVHPGAALVSAGLIETRGGGFGFYADAFSSGAGRIVERIDAERVAILDAFGLPPVSAIEWFRRFYADQGMRGDTLAEMLATFPPFQHAPAPNSLRHRYFREDVPFGLVPMASLARQLGKPAAVMEAVIALCSIVCDEDFWALGRTTESLGLHKLSLEDVLVLVRNG